MVDPLDVPKDSGSTLPRLSFDGKKVVLHVVTDGNPTAQTDSTAGLALEVEGNKNTKIPFPIGPFVRSFWFIIISPT